MSISCDWKYYDTICVFEHVLICCRQAACDQEQYEEAAEISEQVDSLKANLIQVIHSFLTTLHPQQLVVYTFNS